MQLILGIDGGGTSCRAALATAAGEILGRGRSGPANIMTDLAGARDNIVEAARLACRDAGHDAGAISETRALLGLAGANVGAYKGRLIELLPFRESVVESDALIALIGALGEHDGAISIIGTGSIFMARRGAETRTIGGWGFAIGDLGGGARIGRDLLEEVLLSHDGIREGSALTETIMEEFKGDPRNLVEFAAAAKPRDFGRFAPLVVDLEKAGDAVAARVLARAVGHIEEAIAALGLVEGERLCLLGGLGALMAPHLSAAVRRFLAEPLTDALGGAVAMAAARFARAAEAAR